MKALFIKLFEPFLATFVASLHAMNKGKLTSLPTRDTTSLWNFAKAFDGWDKVFDKLLRGFEEKAAMVLDLCTMADVCLLDVQERKSRFRPVTHTEQINLSPPSDDFSTRMLLLLTVSSSLTPIGPSSFRVSRGTPRRTTDFQERPSSQR
jgi:signal recognition particle receptor subunit alpha